MARVTLSFDNGPVPPVTNAVLDILAAHGVKASFFVLGSRLGGKAVRETLRCAREAGHWIGNHTFSHSIPLGRMRNPEAAVAEIRRTEEALAFIDHAVPGYGRLFRPFGMGLASGQHLLRRAAYDYLRMNGFSLVLWTSVPEDWKDPRGWDTRALADCRKRQWSLVVLHDVENAALGRLDAFLTALRADGFDIVQDFPPDCVPLKAGAPQQDTADLIMD